MLMKTSEQTDCPTLLETRGRGRDRGRKTKRREGNDETNWLKAQLVLGWFRTRRFAVQHVPEVCPMSANKNEKVWNKL